MNTMSNRASLERTLFAGNGDNGGWGWRIYDDYFRSFADDHEETEVPKDPLQLLTKACAEATEQERLFFDDLLTQGKGMLINESWHEFEEIEPALRAGLEKEN
jgi:hypothetical protein